MAKLKVFGGAHLDVPKAGIRQVYAVIAATSQKKAAESLNIPLSYFRAYFSETGIATAIEVALKNPGQVFYTSLDNYSPTVSDFSPLQ